MGKINYFCVCLKSITLCNCLTFSSFFCHFSGTTGNSEQKRIWQTFRQLIQLRFLLLYKRKVGIYYTVFLIKKRRLTDAQFWTVTLSNWQKQLPEVFYKKSCSQKFPNIHRKTPVLESLFQKVADLQDCNFIKKRLLHRYFSVMVWIVAFKTILTQ